MLGAYQVLSARQLLSVENKMYAQRFKNALSQCTSIIIMTVLFTFLHPCPILAAPAQLEAKNTYAVIVGVLEWQSRSHSPFSKTNRRDQGLYDQLKSMGVPEKNMALLLGKNATEAKMLEAITKVSKSAEEGATLIFYYAGHGYPGAKGIYFANYDAGAKGSSSTGFLISNISDILKRCYKGRRVLLFADCCYSGGLADVAHSLSKDGFKAASLTSASIANVSTGNWTFTCCIIDALKGRALLDIDGDGFVSISEAAHDVKNAMNILERQNCGSSLHGLDPSFRLSKAPSERVEPNAIPKPFELRQFVSVKGQRRRKAARIVDYKNGKFGLEIQQYHDRTIVWHKPDAISKIERRPLPVVATSARDFPKPLSPEEAAEKATVNGKYSRLMRTIEVKYDYLAYKEFSDYGFSKESSYAGETNIPDGYWVYVYPNWYVYEKENKIKDNPKG